MKIYIDADACPVKDEVYRVARRYQVGVTVVANMRMRVPTDPIFHLHLVENDLDAADDWIVSNVQPGDIVITIDIPLADRCLKQNAIVLGHKGKQFTESGVGQAVAMRNLLSELREMGEITGGPSSMTRRDRSRFLQELNNIIQNAQTTSG